jgi:hypothetical protein
MRVLARGIRAADIKLNVRVFLRRVEAALLSQVTDIGSDL